MKYYLQGAALIVLLIVLSPFVWVGTIWRHFAGRKRIKTLTPEQEYWETRSLR